MKYGLLFVVYILVCGPLISSAKNSIPTQSEAQAKFDAAVSSSDHVYVEHYWFSNVKMPDERLRHISVCELLDKQEIQSLSQYVRIILPSVEKRVINGKEVIEEILPGHLDCFGCFKVILKKNEETVLEFYIFDSRGKYIGCDAILEDSAIEVDLKAMAGFYKKLVDVRDRKTANQALVPTATSVTPAADAPVAPAAAAAHL